MIIYEKQKKSNRVHIKDNDSNRLNNSHFRVIEICEIEKGKGVIMAEVKIILKNEEIEEREEVLAKIQKLSRNQKIKLSGFLSGLVAGIKISEKK